MKENKFFLNTALAVVVGIPLGIISALKKDKLADNIITTGALVGISIPNFLFGVLLMYVFSVKLKVLPSGGMTHYFWTPTGFKQAILPSIALASNSVATFIRVGRSSMLDVLQSDYIRTAKSKGLKQSVIVVIHALRNALIPILTQLGTTFGSLLGGAMITEKVFVINGIGTYMIDGITKRNYPVVQSTVLIVAAMFIIINLIVDLVYSAVDPRIRYE